MNPFSLPSIFRYLGASPYRRSQLDGGEEAQRILTEKLWAQHANLADCRDFLDKLATQLEGAGTDLKRTIKRWAEDTLPGFERVRIENRLAFWLAYIDDDASGLDTAPHTREDVVNALESGKARFHPLNMNDGLHRECAALLAQIFCKACGRCVAAGSPESASGLSVHLSCLHLGFVIEGIGRT